MATRVVIETGLANPFRISQSGVNANGAYNEQLLFDGNFKSLRVYQKIVLTGGWLCSSNHSTGVLTFSGFYESAFGKTFSAPPLAIAGSVRDSGTAKTALDHVRTWLGFWTTTTHIRGGYQVNQPGPPVVTMNVVVLDKTVV